ncbi:MAG: c-type cytochrome [Acidobacteria bacterium]|nr:c-type cytochrome [Acidobacteriota bacterium]
MIRGTNGIAALGLVLLSGSIAVAQPPAGGGQRGGGAPAPQPMTNLQIFPKDAPRQQVLQTMNAFTQALGVQCNYCHVQEGRGGRNDMASDEKPTKKAARGMVLLARDINEKLPAAVGKSADAATRVGCATCHRGVAIPKQITDIVTDAAAGGGATAGLAKFRELRTQYYGGQSYDFSEGSLIAIAQRANQAQKADDALAYLQANLEFYPKSSRTYQTMAQVKNAKGDKDGAIKDLEKAVELEPNNQQAKMQLQQLKG